MPVPVPARRLGRLVDDDAVRLGPASSAGCPLGARFLGDHLAVLRDGRGALVLRVLVVR